MLHLTLIHLFYTYKDNLVSFMAFFLTYLIIAIKLVSVDGIKNIFILTFSSMDKIDTGDSNI